MGVKNCTLDKQSRSYLLFLILLLVLSFIAYWLIGIPALMMHLTFASEKLHWPEWWPVLFYSIGFLLWIIYCLLLLCLLRYIELRMERQISKIVRVPKKNSDINSPQKTPADSETQEWVIKKKHSEKVQILRSGSDKTPSYDTLSQEQCTLPTPNQQFCDASNRFQDNDFPDRALGKRPAATPVEEVLPTSRRHSKVQMELKRLSLVHNFPDTFENQIATRRSMSADFTDLSQMGSFDSYLHLVDIDDTPMSPRNLFFRDLIKSAEEYDKRMAKSIEEEPDKRTANSVCDRQPTSSTGEYYIAEVSKRPPSVVTEAYIEVEDNSPAYLWDHAEGQWALLRDPLFEVTDDSQVVAGSKGTKVTLYTEEEIEDSVFK